jgi:hypothetical protein
VAKLIKLTFHSGLNLGTLEHLDNRTIKHSDNATIKRRIHSTIQLYTMRNLRKCIYTKDVQWITGKSESASRKLLQKIKRELKKHRHQFVTFQEFCDYTGLQEEDFKGEIK